MKSFALALLASIFLLSSAMANPPALNAVQAATIAQQDLEMRGLQDRIHISQIIHKSGRFGAPEHWEVLWNDTFPAQTEGREEFGLKITMDGNYKRSIR